MGNSQWAKDLVGEYINMYMKMINNYINRVRRVSISVFENEHFDGFEIFQLTEYISTVDLRISFRTDFFFFKYKNEKPFVI